MKRLRVRRSWAGALVLVLAVLVAQAVAALVVWLVYRQVRKRWTPWT